MVGCGVSLCPSIPLSDDSKVFNTKLVVCKYADHYFSDGNVLPYQAGKCDVNRCPPNFKMCVPYKGLTMPPRLTVDDSELYCGK